MHIERISRREGWIMKWIEAIKIYNAGNRRLTFAKVVKKRKNIMIRKFNNFVPIVFTVNLFGAVFSPSVLTNTEDYIDTDIRPGTIFSGRSKHSKMAALLNARDPKPFDLNMELLLFAGGV
jgi:hypothetical protein